MAKTSKISLRTTEALKELLDYLYSTDKNARSFNEKCERMLERQSNLELRSIKKSKTHNF